MRSALFGLAALLLSGCGNRDQKDEPEVRNRPDGTSPARPDKDDERPRAKPEEPASRPALPSETDAAKWTHEDILNYLRAYGLREVRMRPVRNGDLSVWYIFAADDNEEHAVYQWVTFYRVSGGRPDGRAVRCTYTSDADSARRRAGTNPDGAFTWGRYLFESDPDDPDYLHKVRHAVTGRAIPPPKPKPDPAPERRLDRLKKYRDQRDYPALVGLLEDLGRTDSMQSGDAPDRVELSRLLREMCGDRDSAIRLKAMPAYVRWAMDPNDARDVCLAALRSQSDDERVAALELLPRWKSDEGVARAIGSRIGHQDRRETDVAVRGLTEIGGRSAEQTALSLLWAEKSTHDTRLSAISILKSVGTPTAAAGLREWSRSPKFADDPVTQESARACADYIENLTPKK